MSDQLPESGPTAAEESMVTCVEVYMPKRLAHLSELYNLLREAVQSRRGPLVLDGFTIYEGDGAFWDEGLFEERTLIIRILFTNIEWEDEVVRIKINELGRILAEEVAPSQRQIWITGVSGRLAIFEGAKADEKPGGV